MHAVAADSFLFANFKSAEFKKNAQLERNPRALLEKGGQKPSISPKNSVTCF